MSLLKRLCKPFCDMQYFRIRSASDIPDRISSTTCLALSFGLVASEEGAGCRYQPGSIIPATTIFFIRL